MAVIRLKPYILQYLVYEEGYVDEIGDYHEGKSFWDGFIPCDAVPLSGKASQVKFDDGTSNEYSYIVYLNNDVKDFYVGEQVRIIFGNTEKEFKVKGFQRWQLQCKLWV